MHLPVKMFPVLYGIHMRNTFHSVQYDFRSSSSIREITGGDAASIFGNITFHKNIVSGSVSE